MNVVLQVRSGPSAGRVFQLRGGQAGRFGSSEWADFPLPEATDLAAEHFALECSSRDCRLQSLGEAETLVNGDPVNEATLAHGDVVSAGGVEFVLYVEGATTTAAETAEPVESPAPAIDVPAGPVELCERLGLSSEAPAIAAETAGVPEFIEALVAADLFDDAVRVTAHDLGIPASLTWAADCVRDGHGAGLGPADVAALEAATAWIDDPSEEHRQAANAAAEATDYSTGAPWVALAAAWSEGSLAPAGLPDAPPPPDLSLQGIAGAIALAATSGPPAESADRYRRFLTAARG